MATQVGEAVIKLTFDGKNVKSELSSMESKFSSLSGKVGGFFKGVAKASVAAFTTASVATGAFVTKLTKSAVDSYGEYEQLTGGIETLFKDSYSRVMSYAEDAYKNVGMSANEYMDTVTSFSARLLQGLGGDTEKAADYADRAITDMADNANKMGTSMEMIQNAYQGFAKQNYTMLDNLKLGYGGTAGEMARLINDSGVLGDTMTVTAETVNSVSFDKIIDAIHVVQENMDITGTTAKEASNTIQGSFNSMKSAWTNLVTGLANGEADFNQLLNNLVDSVGTFIANLLPAIENTLPRIGELVEKLVPIILEKLPGLIQTLLPQFINVVVQIANAIINNLPMILTTVLGGFLRALPSLIQSIVGAIPQIITAIVDFFTDPGNIGLMVDAAIQLFMGLVMAVPQILGALIGAFGKLVGNLWSGITSMFGEFAANFGNFIGNIFKNAINGVLTFIENIINGPIDLINGFIGVINDAFGWIGVNLGKIDRIQLPRLATGGIAVSATTAIIGEEGKEAVLPLENNTDNWAGTLSSILIDKMNENETSLEGRNINVYMTNEINNQLDAQEIGRIMMQSIRRAA